MNKKVNTTYKRVGAAIAMIFALVAGMMLSPALALAQTADDPSTGNGQGDTTAWSGTYNTPLASGGEEEGYCIDFGKAYPKQIEGNTYGEAHPWDALNGNAEAKDKLLGALMIDKTIRTGTVPQYISDALGTNDAKAIFAAVSGVAHAIGSQVDPATGAGAKPWNADSLPTPEARAAFDKMMQGSIEGLPDTAGIDVQIREPSQDAQRMLVVKDVPLPEPEVEDTPEETTTPEITTPETTEPEPQPEENNPSIKTAARIEGSNVIQQGATVVDRVTYNGLATGENYTLEAELMCKATGQSTGAKATQNFTPSAANGMQDVNIPVTDANCAEQVAFETLKNSSGSTVAEHKDINDRAQTVGQKTEPRISTTAKLDNGNDITKDSTVTDTVAFEGLTPGENYTLEAELMCKENGQSTGATASQDFTPNAQSGAQDVNIPVTDANCFKQVAFETLKDSKGTVVAEHKDINDQAQTVGQEPVFPKINVTKMDNKNQFLPGAKLSITDQDGKVMANWDSKNEVTTLIVRPGTYTITENQAPAGFLKSDDSSAKVEVKMGENKNVTFVNVPEQEKVASPAPSVKPGKAPVAPGQRMMIQSVPSGPTSK